VVHDARVEVRGTRLRAHYVYFILDRNPLIEPNNVEVLTGVENESTGTRPKLVGINHERPVPAAFSRVQSDAGELLALSVHRIFSRFIFPSVLLSASFLSVRILISSFYSDTREYVCVDVSSF